MPRAQAWDIPFALALAATFEEFAGRDTRLWVERVLRPSLAQLQEEVQLTFGKTLLGPALLDVQFGAQDARTLADGLMFTQKMAAFAVAKLVWILNGRQDAAFLNFWNACLSRYAGQGGTYHGADTG